MEGNEKWKEKWKEEEEVVKSRATRDPVGSQDVSEPVVLGVRGREVREEGGEIVEDLVGELYRALRREHEAPVAEADRKRGAGRGERDRAPAANRIRHGEHERSRDEESVGARQGRFHRWRIYFFTTSFFLPSPFSTCATCANNKFFLLFFFFSFPNSKDLDTVYFERGAKGVN